MLRGADLADFAKRRNSEFNFGVISPGKVDVHGARVPPQTRCMEATALPYTRRMEAPHLYRLGDFTGASIHRVYGGDGSSIYQAIPGVWRHLICTS